MLATSLDVLEDDPQHLAGREVPVEITEEEWNGKIRLKCEIQAGTPPSKSKRAEWDQKLRGARQAAETMYERKEEEPPPPADEEIPNGTDDGFDVPF